jgi:NAD(P)H dehydrogenase (quinone)
LVHRNYFGALAPALAHGAVPGSSGEGRISAAARADYAAAAAAILVGAAPAGGHIFELAGDTAFTMADFAAELSRQAGKPVTYADLPKPDYKSLLLSAGLPQPVAELVADSSEAARGDTLFDASHTLSRLIGRPTVSLADSLATALTLA